MGEWAEYDEAVWNDPLERTEARVAELEEALREVRTEVERLKRLLEEARWYVSEYAYATSNPTARALMAEVDAALAERGEGV